MCLGHPLLHLCLWKEGTSLACLSERTDTTPFHWNHLWDVMEKGPIVPLRPLPPWLVGDLDRVGVLPQFASCPPPPLPSARRNWMTKKGHVLLLSSTHHHQERSVLLPFFQATCMKLLACCRLARTVKTLAVSKTPCGSYLRNGFAQSTEWLPSLQEVPSKVRKWLLQGSYINLFSARGNREDVGGQDSSQTFWLGAGVVWDTLDLGHPF